MQTTLAPANVSTKLYGSVTALIIITILFVFSDGSLFVFVQGTKPSAKKSLTRQPPTTTTTTTTTVTPLPPLRVSYGTHAMLPPVALEEMQTEGKTPLSSMCKSLGQPLHVALVLSPVALVEPLTALENVATLHNQVLALTTNPTKYLVDNAFVTAVAEVLPLPTADDDTKRIVYALLHFSSRGNPRSNGRRSATLLTWNTTTVHQSTEDGWASIVTSLNKDNLKIEQSTTPHFVFTLPPKTIFTSANMRGLCYLDTVINGESESTSVYPFAAPFVPGGRVHERNGRLSLGFVSVVGDQTTVVSSCRRPVTFASSQLAVDGGHYSKGGDMVMRGFLWALDLGSALRRNNISVVPSRSVLIPYMAGVHSDLILDTVDEGAATPALTHGQRMAVFPLRRKIIDSHCSSDPSDPVRVSTQMVIYVTDNLDDMRNGFDIFVRVINSTALMTSFSDLTISTNLHAEELLKYLRAEARERDPSFLDKSFGNPLGELVIMTSHHKTDGSWFGLTGNTHFPLMSQLGFYDLVRYTEDDVYLSRDQFDFYCATLPFLEARDEYLNQIRWEAPWDDVDEGPAQPVVKKNRKDRYFYRRTYVNVLQSKVGRNVSLLDRRLKNGWSWRQDREAFGINVTVKTNQSQQTDDRSRNTVAYPVPATPIAYDVSIVPLKTCRFQGNASTHLRNTTEANVSGLYTVAYANNPRWGRNDIYSAMWIMPTHRIQHHFLDGKKAQLKKRVKGPGWRGLTNSGFNLNRDKLPFNRHHSKGLFRESIVYFANNPLNSYNGGVFLLFMEEGEGLDAFKSREEGGTEYGKEQGYYGLHRLSAINHGSNTGPNREEERPDGQARFKLPSVLPKI